MWYISVNGYQALRNTVDSMNDTPGTPPGRIPKFRITLAIERLIGRWAPGFSVPHRRYLTRPVLLLIIACTIFFSWHIAMNRARTAGRRLHEANSLMMHGKFGEAIDTYDHVLSVFPRAKLAWAGRGVCLLRLGRFDEALVSYERTLRLDPSYFLACEGKGISLEELGRSDEAIRWYVVCERYHPNNTRLTALRARITDSEPPATGL